MLIVASANIRTDAQNSASELVTRANAAYEKDDFNQAIKLYEEAAAADGTSSELYYNMGNTYYRLGNMGKAILYYERSLMLDPSNDDARTNLDFVNDKIQLKVDRGTTFFSDTIGGFVKRTSSNTWGWAGVICFLLFIGATLIYIFMDAVVLRKIGFFGGGILLILSILANVCAFYTHSSAVNHDYAIVTVPSVTLSTSPRIPKDKSEEAFLLNEGTKVEIVDSLTNTSQSGIKDTWLDVKADEQHRAWVNARNVEKI